MPAPSFLLDLRFSDLDGWWMRLDCCGRTVCLPFRNLALQKPPARLGDLLTALRCRDCGQSPQRVVLIENPADRAHGWTGSGGWRIEVVMPDGYRNGPAAGDTMTTPGAQCSGQSR
jgi:hypothetical protein